MSDVNTFIDTIGKDVATTVAPQIDNLAKGIGAKATADYVPQITALANKLVKQIVDEQSVAVRDFSTKLIQDLFQRYRPELAGELRTRIVADGVEVVGQGVRLDVKRRDTGAVVSSLDIPVSLTIKVDGVSLTLTETVVALDVVR
jgi:hypothetical protein